MLDLQELLRMNLQDGSVCLWASFVKYLNFLKSHSGIFYLNIFIDPCLSKHIGTGWFDMTKLTLLFLIGIFSHIHMYTCIMSVIHLFDLRTAAGDEAQIHVHDGHDREEYLMSFNWGTTCHT